MIDIRSIAADAASQFGLSLKDDPTAWDQEIDGEPDALGPEELTPSAVVERCRGEAKYNAISAVNRALGLASEKIATAMDVAIHEDGPLADLDEVWGQFVTGLSVDLSGVVEAKDWQGRVDALREAIRRSAPSIAHAAPVPHLRDVLAYLNSDPRFDGNGALKKGVAAIREPGDDEDFTPPAFLMKGQPGEIVALHSEPQVEAEAPSWEDDEEPSSPADVSWDDEPAKPTRKRGNGKGAKANTPSAVPGFPAMLNAAGMTKADVARLCGYSESYIGYIFNGRKPWPGLRPDQVKALRDEMVLRHGALGEALAIIASGKLLLPGEV